MQADKKIEAFVVDSREEFLYYGTLSGQIVAMRVDNFKERREIQAHAGTIIAMAVHERLPYLTCLALDRTVSVWRLDGLNVTPLGFVSIRNLEATNDSVHYSDIRSNAQAIAFHPVEHRIATRTANGAIAELNFGDDGKFELVRCVRFYPTYDVITVRYTATFPHLLLSGAANGEIVLADAGEVVRRWKIEDESVHWFEHLSDSDYLVASDSRLLARLDISGVNPVVIGEKFARDDFEHVVVNRTDGRVFASSFDRNIYELDPMSCHPIQVTFQAPFKCRWLHSLKKQPERLLVQVRDGSIFDIDSRNGSVLQGLRTTPLSLWTGFFAAAREICLFGEGQRSLRISVEKPSTQATTEPQVQFAEVTQEWLPNPGYVKRAQYCQKRDIKVLGHSSGKLFMKHAEDVTELDLQSAVRDLQIHESGLVYVATERGMAFAVSLDEKRFCQYLSPRNFPFWAIAANPTGSLLVAFERHGSIVVMNAKSLSCIATIPDAGRCKRAKWLDDRLLLFTYAGEIRVFRLIHPNHHHSSSVRWKHG